MFAQTEEAALPRVKVSGLVKTDFFFDTRETVSAREGHFLLFPAPRLNDPDGKDINDKASFNILPIQSNLSVGVSGPVLLGASTSGVIEGDFFGQSNGDVNMFRLRHAYVKMQWEKAELLVGQYWHPLFVTSCYPATISFNTGSPIQPFSRAPQVKISYVPGKFKLSGVLLSQRDYTSVGPEGNNSKYLRDAVIPEIQLNAELTLKKQHEWIIGAGAGYKTLIPQTKTGKGYVTSESVHGLSVNSYLKLTGKNVTLKAYATYLENGSEVLTISGYAVKDSTDQDRGYVDYVPVRTVSYWGELHGNNTRWQPGIFAGYTENLGTGNKTRGPYYLMANMPVKSLFRISPRIVFKPGILSFAAEVEYTSALFGSPDSEGEISDTYRINNTRLLVSVLYKF
ncbi:MAG: hypothetical protein JXA72_13065 [Bacteroidales bacterium]|nr:hypothetical protein [Bacteroidales bacterium]